MMPLPSRRADLGIERKASLEQWAKAPLSMVFTERGSLTESNDVQLLKAFDPIVASCWYQ